MPYCTICKTHEHDEDRLLKHSVRHYAHFKCWLDAGRGLETLKPWQVGKFPFRLLKERGLLEQAEAILDADKQAQIARRAAMSKAALS